jgi:hypothetical protein
MEAEMPEKASNKTSDLKIEIKAGRLIVEIRLKGIWKLPITVAMAIVLLLIVLTILQPERWLEILRAFLVFIGPALAVVTDQNKRH